MAIFMLTCANNAEADKIGKVLLEKKLIACCKKMPVASSFWWKGIIEQTDETVLMMESVEEKFGEVNKEVKKLHSYDTFILFSLPVGQTTKEVQEWLEKELEE